MKQHVVFDTEIIGKDKPVFLVCAEIVETGEQFSFWGSKKKDKQDFIDMLYDDAYTWVSFNGIRFDNPLIQMWIHGYKEAALKHMCTQIITQNMMPWDALRSSQIGEPVWYDHIDLMEVAPGVRTSLKTYAGRMQHPSMIDLPYHHDKDLTAKEKKVLEHYCLNDLSVTKALFLKLKSQIALREELSKQHSIDLRSKSDAQVAETILKKVVGISGRTQNFEPKFIKYVAPAFIKTKNARLAYLIERMEAEEFTLKNGSPQLPPWLENAVIEIGNGEFKVGIGGLHSTHDKSFFAQATDEWLISDFDVASYYPTIMLKCGLTPKLTGGKGEKFLEAYLEIYNKRLKAKLEDDKAVADALKISLNGTFGKLGSVYSALYSPDLLLAVTVTGQLNLLMLIHEMSKIKGVEIISANTDGITVGYHPSVKPKLLKVVASNAKQTGFTYEETEYTQIAMKDVNNYIAITTKGKIKSKGLYAEPGLMKNPTMPICSMAVQAYLKDKADFEHFIQNHPVFSDFTAIRNVKGGAEWHGEQLGRVVRWYISKTETRPIRYTTNGNKVPKTENAKPVMSLPEGMPDDIDFIWYIQETKSMLADMGVTL